MKTRRNNILTPFLLLGAINIILLGFSCKKRTEYIQEAEFYFINNTTHNIELLQPYFKFMVLPNQTNIILEEQVGDGKVDKEDFRNLFTNNVKITDTLLSFKIGDRCLMQTKNSEHSIMNLKNYVAEKRDNITYKFTYTFTDADYERAVICP